MNNVSAIDPRFQKLQGIVDNIVKFFSKDDREIISDELSQSEMEQLLSQESINKFSRIASKYGQKIGEGMAFEIQPTQMKELFKNNRKVKAWRISGVIFGIIGIIDALNLYPKSWKRIKELDDKTAADEWGFFGISGYSFKQMQQAKQELKNILGALRVVQIPAGAQYIANGVTHHGMKQQATTLQNTDVRPREFQSADDSTPVYGNRQQPAAQTLTTPNNDSTPVYGDRQQSAVQTLTTPNNMDEEAQQSTQNQTDNPTPKKSNDGDDGERGYIGDRRRSAQPVQPKVTENNDTPPVDENAASQGHNSNPVQPPVENTEASTEDHDLEWYKNKFQESKKEVEELRELLASLGSDDQSLENTANRGKSLGGSQAA